MSTEHWAERDILLTFEEAAALLRVSRATLYRLIAGGQLTGHKVGRGWRFYKTDLHHFLAAQRSTVPQGLPSATTLDLRQEAAQ